MLRALLTLAVVLQWGAVEAAAQDSWSHSGQIARGPSRVDVSAENEADARTPIRRDATADVSDRPAAPANSLWTSLIILGGVVGGIFWISRGLRRFAPGRFGGLPRQAVDLLGSKPISPQHTLHVVRVGERVLVLGAGADGLRTLSEITDAAEADYLTHLCRAGGGTDPIPPSTPQRGQNTEAAEASQPANRLRTLQKSAALLACLMSGSALAQEQPLTGTSRPGVSQTQWSTQAELSRPDAVSPAVYRAAASTSSSGEARPQEFQRQAEQDPERNSSLTTLIEPEQVGSSLKMVALVGVLSLAPAILLMTTCYVRIVIVLGILKQALGVQQFPPAQVLASLGLFLTALVMWPVWERAYREGIEPYGRLTFASRSEQQSAFAAACERTALPVRTYMSRQIEATGNEAALDMFLDYEAAGEPAATPQPQYYEDVPLRVLLPSFLLSELKTAFLIGFQIYLPFVVIDLVVASVLTGMGLPMLPPTMVSLPFKLLLFVLIDGWFLTVETLLSGIAPLG